MLNRTMGTDEAMVREMLDKIQVYTKTSDAGYVSKKDISAMLADVTGKVYGKKYTRDELIAELQNVAAELAAETQSADVVVENANIPDSVEEELDDEAYDGTDREVNDDTYPSVCPDSPNKACYCEGCADHDCMAYHKAHPLNVRTLTAEQEAEMVRWEERMRKADPNFPYTSEDVQEDQCAYNPTNDCANCSAHWCECNPKHNIADYDPANIDSADDAVTPVGPVVPKKPLPAPEQPVANPDWNRRNALLVLGMVLKDADRNEYMDDYISTHMLTSHICEVLFGRPLSNKDGSKNKFTAEEQKRVYAFFASFKEQYLVRKHKKNGYIITSEAIAAHHKGKSVIYRYKSETMKRPVDYRVSWSDGRMYYLGKSVELAREVYKKLDETCTLFRIV